VVAPPSEAEQQQAGDLDELLRRALARVSVKDAVSEVAMATGRPRREVYERALALAERTADAKA
jgi:16S rRNA (cytidine1402-2'-O)-methyltransferase